MGTGSKPTESKVKKTRQGYGGEGGGGRQEDISDSCLFSVRSEVSIDVSLRVSKGDAAVIVPNHASGGLDLYLSDNLIGLYKGKSAKRMFDCISKGYIYEGLINEVTVNGSTSTVQFSLVGKKR